MALYEQDLCQPETAQKRGKSHIFTGFSGRDVGPPTALLGGRRECQAV